MKIKMDQGLRYVVQWGFLVFLLSLAYLHDRYGGGVTGFPTVCSICPFGGMETLYAWFSAGTFIRRTSPADLVLLFGFIGITLILGRTFCGAICPLGTVQEWMTKGGRALGIRARELPSSIDRPLRFLKYGVFLAIIFFTWSAGELIWRDYDPWVALMHVFEPLELVLEKPIGLAVLVGIVLIGTIFIERAWCRYFCPLGALLSVFHFLSPLKVRRNQESCIDCGLCDLSCPVKLDISDRETVNSPECIQCGKCTDACPVPKTLEIGTKKGSRFSYLKILVATLLIFLVVYGISRATGHWMTYAPMTQTTRSVESPAPLPGDGIQGSAKLETLAEHFGLDAETILEKAGWPLDVPRDRSLREIMTERPELDLSIRSIRDAVNDLLKQTGTE
jgi:polyferredoxin